MVDFKDTKPFYSDQDNLYKYREQVTNKHTHHSENLLNVQKYFTTIISAIFSIMIGILLTFIRFSGDLDLLFLITTPLIFVGIGSVIIVLGWVALNNCAREYRNTMEYAAILMKIDWILGMYDTDLYKKFKEKSQLNIFNKDETFGNPRWAKSHEKYKFDEISSEEFVNNQITKKDRRSAFYYYSSVFRLYLIIGFGTIFFAYLFLLNFGYYLLGGPLFGLIILNILSFTFFIIFFRRLYILLTQIDFIK